MSYRECAKCGYVPSKPVHCAGCGAHGSMVEMELSQAYERDDTWLIRANIEHRVAAMYEEALRAIARQADHVTGDLAREALGRAEQVGKESQREAIDIPGKLVKMRRDTIEECAQTVEAIRDGADVLPRYLVLSRIRGLVPAHVPMCKYGVPLSETCSQCKHGHGEVRR